MMLRRLAPTVLAALVAFAHVAAAQSNQIPGLDVSLGALGPIDALGRTGVYPNGVNGVAFETTACNKGTFTVPWKDPDGAFLGGPLQVMNDDSPWISQLIVREDALRLVQINRRSFLKRGFGVFAQSVCDACTGCGPFGICEYLSPGCSDTYTVGLNGNNYYLSPPDELDPWLGTWSPFGSHFDRGQPPVAPPFDTDGIRSLDGAMASALLPVGNRMQVEDADFDVAGAPYYYQGGYTVQGEPEASRGNNIGSRAFVPSWNAATVKWDLTEVGALLEGTVLQRWTGASVDSGTNGGDDGRVFVAVKVTGPVAGVWHYEFAVHNRDNLRGVGALRIPTCAGARVWNVGFRDADLDPLNDWTFTQGATELVFATATDPLRWNSIYNVWFDSDAAPDTTGNVTLDAFSAGGGAPALTIGSAVPTGLYNEWLGAGCAAGAPPSLSATGSPPRATIGNASFGVASAGNAPGQSNYLLLGWIDGAISLGGGCMQWMGGLIDAGILLASVSTADAAGVANHALPVPADPSLEGQHVNLQAVGTNVGGGVLLGLFDLSDGLRVRVGDALAGCP